MGILLLSGCAGLPSSAGPLKGEPTAPPAQTGAIGTGEEAAPPGERPSGKVETLILPDYERPQSETPVLLSPIDPALLGLEDTPVMINADGMPISDFITYAIGNSLKVPFFMDEAVKTLKTPVTLRMPREVPAPLALELAVGILLQNNLTVGQRAGSLFILNPKPEAPAPFDVQIGRGRSETPGLIVQLVPLRHTRPADIESLIRDLYKTGVTIKTYPRENALLLTGPGTAIKDILNFVEMLDVPYLNEKRVVMIQLTYWGPDEFIQQIGMILQRLGFAMAGSPQEPGISFIPLKFLNSLLIVAPDETTLKVVLEWKDRLDTAESAGAGEKAFSYSPKYSKASDLADAIKRLYGLLPAKDKAPLPAPTTAGFKMEADDRRNLLLMITTPSIYKVLLSLLDQLDKPPRQVLLQTTIAELTLTDQLKYGLEWFINKTIDRGAYTVQTLGQLGLSTGQGLTFQAISDTKLLQVAISALAVDNKINILSNPRVMVLDNEEATIQIGTEVPIVTGEVSASDVTQTQSPSIVRNIQYRSTGVILRVKPTINTEGLLTLSISQEVSEAQSNPTSGIDSPIILVRRINTQVVASHRESIILGGLMSENVSTTENKIPLLGDIPLLGHLFKTTSRGKTKTELIILITPTILTTTEDAVRVTEEIKRGLKGLKLP
ncbi:MAG: secretin N-terminal domain-containing protein [Nitrospirota bacterium]